MILEDSRRQKTTQPAKILACQTRFSLDCQIKIPQLFLAAWMLLELPTNQSIKKLVGKKVKIKTVLQNS
ncbi:MAG: hypothetical protein IGS49_08345 [Chlorogloeopsis fritschii C42_A2020_084]|nr:hypothetical protein [Chlorogloeopsis fritschii C42_A2020_084]